MSSKCRRHQPYDLDNPANWFVNKLKTSNIQVIPDADQRGKQKPSAWLEMSYSRTPSTPLDIDRFN